MLDSDAQRLDELMHIRFLPKLTSLGSEASDWLTDRYINPETTEIFRHNDERSAAQQAISPAIAAHEQHAYLHKRYHFHGYIIWGRNIILLAQDDPQNALTSRS